MLNVQATSLGYFFEQTIFKHSFMLSRKFYIISNQQYVIHIYLSEML